MVRQSSRTSNWLDWFTERDDMTGDNSALQRRALAALILAESQRDGGRQGARLPTERQLALDIGVSRAAIRHAMALLQAEGHVSREVGRGTFLRGVPDAGAAGPVDAPAAPGARMRRYRKLRRRPRGRTTKP